MEEIQNGRKCRYDGSQGIQERKKFDSMAHGSKIIGPKVKVVFTSSCPTAPPSFMKMSSQVFE